MCNELEMNLSELSPLDKDFFQSDDVDSVARRLIGVILVFDNGKAGPIGGRIVETESYDENDPAAHCYKNNPKKGSETMRLSGGHSYMFSASYGFCLNFVTGHDDVGSAVLIRSLEPLVGLEVMKIRRGPYCPAAIGDKKLLCHTPITLCESLGITDHHNKLSLYIAPYGLYARQGCPQISSEPRVRVLKTIKKYRPDLDQKLVDAAINARRRWIDEALIDYVIERDRPRRNRLLDLRDDRTALT
jgi:DNA-3-methyladenine glycosylase